MLPTLVKRVLVHTFSSQVLDHLPNCVECQVWLEYLPVQESVKEKELRRLGQGEPVVGDESKLSLKGTEFRGGCTELFHKEIPWSC